MKKKEKKLEKDFLIRIYAEELGQLHPRLPAYFCGNNGIIVPIPIDGDVEQYMAERGFVRFAIEEHVDTDVLCALHELKAEWEKRNNLPACYSYVAFKLLRTALSDKNSKLSQTLAKAYGQ